MKRMARLAAATLAAALSMPAMAQDQPAMTEIADGIYHFWHSGYSSLVVVGDDGVLVTDTAFTPRAEAMKAEIEAITDKPVTHVALTHEHFDHVGGTGTFPDAEIVCHEICGTIFALSPLMDVPEVDTTFGKELTLDLGGHSVHLLHIAAGDGVATTVMRVPAADVVFSVDMYAESSFVPSEFKEDTNFVGARQILNELVAMEPAYAINGHEPGNSVDGLRQNADMLNALYDRVLAEIETTMAEEGPGAAFGLLFTMPGELKMEEYADWENYETGFPAYVRRMALSILHGG